jgi:cytosine/adenosine deaminase-related metal-dependent hydrolase
VRTDGVAMGGTLGPGGVGAAAALVFAGRAADVTDVVVGGRQIVTGGVHHLGPIGPRLERAVAGLWGQ